MGIKKDLRILQNRDRVHRFWWWQTSIPSHQDESCQHYANIRLIYVNMQRFVCGFTSLPKIFHSYGDVTITSEGLHILTFSRHSWPLINEGSLACHTYCDTVHHLRGPVTLPPVAVRSIVELSLLSRLRSVATEDRTRIVRMRGEALPLSHRGGNTQRYYFIILHIACWYNFTLHVNTFMSDVDINMLIYNLTWFFVRIE